MGVDLFTGVSEYGPFAECPEGLLVAVGSRAGDGACGPAAPTALEVSEETGCRLEP